MPLNPRITHWQGRVVWLVGASSGIGEATARALHAAGARVVVSARSAEPLTRFAAAHPGNSHPGQTFRPAILVGSPVRKPSLPAWLRQVVTKPTVALAS